MSRPVSIRGTIQAAIIALLAGWLFALVAGLVLSRLQYTEISGVFPAERMATEYQGRLDRLLLQGPLLLLLQSGVTAAALVWQVVRTSRTWPARQPLWQGAVAGGMVALMQSIIAANVLHAQLAFIVPLALLLIGAGLYAGLTTRIGPVLDVAHDTKAT